ncbi:isoaspartyl peptidase/L-asparaginase-like [Dendronephthya gigantea]|uniref:isoaspartyl peptidase/L-asparaginase-like n=1 Tax=Dendronephthya gigantea TaxID=151771 RepID=UPI00106D72F4|nr:isoaspartyl peptidase/L-asparaginase-like [Dendronephthya gigantea]
MAESITSGTSNLSISSSSATERERAREREIKPRILVQAGAFSHVLCDIDKEYKRAPKSAAKEGYYILRNGGTAVDAVETAVRVLEDNGYCNAGFGSYLNNNNEVECDALIMDGDTLKNGAVMAGRHFRNPVSLAKKIMKDCHHSALSGEGALEFARKCSFPCYDQDELISKYSRDKTQEVNYENMPEFIEHHYPGKPQMAMDTVTAVAMDADGKMACAVSTGGIAGKLKGRVGDVPMVGCGGYANKSGAATTTGHGESIIKMTLARDVVSMMEAGTNAQTSADNAVRKLLDTIGNLGAGGVIAIDKDGNFGKACRTEKMPWASIMAFRVMQGEETEIMQHRMESGVNTIDEPEIEYW